MGRSAYFRKGVVRVHADRYKTLLDFLLEAVSDEGTTPFPAHVLAGMRRVVRCETVSYREWSPQELLELSLAADEPEAVMQVWPGYRHVRRDDPLPGGARNGRPVARPRMARPGPDDLRFHQRPRVPPPGTVCRDVQAARRAGRDEGVPANRRRGNRRAARLRHHQEQVHRHRPPRSAAAHPVPGAAAAQRARPEELPGASGFHGSSPDEAAAPDPARAGGPGPGCRRRDERHDRASPLHRPRDRPQAP